MYQLTSLNLDVIPAGSKVAVILGRYDDSAADHALAVEVLCSRDPELLVIVDNVRPVHGETVDQAEFRFEQLLDMYAEDIAAGVVELVRDHPIGAASRYIIPAPPRIPVRPRIQFDAIVLQTCDDAVIERWTPLLVTDGICNWRKA